MARKKLRTTRRALSLEGAVVAGNPRVRPIVYGYRFSSHPDRMKIGYSSRGVERIREQTTGFPEQPQVVFVLHHADAAEIERRLHQSLAGRQVQDTVGVEWFGVGFADVVRVSPELRAALGQERWRSVWRWMALLCAALLGALVAPVVAGMGGRPSVAGVDLDAYVRALWEGHGATWRFTFQQAWRVVTGPIGLEVRVLALAFPVALAVWMFGRR